VSAFYDQDWIDAASAAFGDACRLRVLVRDKANELLDLTATETVLTANPISREVERAVGVMQGQTWDVELTRSPAAPIPPGGLDDCWCQLRGVIGGAEAPLATGRIRGYRASSDGTMRFSVEDPLVALINARFPRDVGWYQTGFAGLIRTLDANGSYDNNWDPTGQTVGVVKYAGNEFRLQDTSYTITFLTGTQFEVRDDTVIWGEQYYTTGTITADLNAASSQNQIDPVVTIKADGWSDEAGAYTAGDKFTFATSAVKTTGRSPVNILIALIEQCAGLIVRDVLSGDDFSTPRYDAQYSSGHQWYDALVDTTSQRWAGWFERGDDVIKAVQGVLRVLNWALFCVPDGRIALYRPLPGDVHTAVLNGEWTSGAVNVISSERTETMEYAANVVRFTCPDITGREVAAESRDDNSPYPPGLIKEFEIPWIVPFGVLRAAASQTLARLKRARELFSAETTFAGASLLPGGVLLLHDPAGGAIYERLTAARVKIDPVGDSAAVVGFRDPLSGEGFFIIGGPDTDPVGSQIGGEGDPGAAQLW